MKRNFDTDSAKIGVYNRWSACISHYINDFYGPVQKFNLSIKVFGGDRTMNVYLGGILCKWCNN